MMESINKLKNEAAGFVINDTAGLETYRLKYLSKKGLLSDLFDEFRNIPSEQKKEAGAALNQLKNFIQTRFDEAKLLLETTGVKEQKREDITRPADYLHIGSRHPLALVKNEIVSVFEKIGYTISEGPEMEDDWHNFSALNFPEDHPARDMQDTFFLEDGFSLRTHTSSVQVRVMENNQPPLRTISPGRVYRNEAISARAHCFFHQVEGLYIDTNVSFADLKQDLLFFAREMFGASTKIRMRPSYFPFTEPSAEMDVSCFICNGNGCNVCKHSGWVEILGCGMVDPQVLTNCKIDAGKYSGFAFGMGIERITMLKYKVNDLRLFSENDVRFLEQFRSVWQ